MKTCWLAGGGDFFAEGFAPEKGDTVIAVDAGLERLKELEIEPDVIIGDFDSLGYVPEGDKTQKHPCQKDDTDMMLAVKYGIDLGCERFLIFGGTGGRISHTLGNFQVLAFLAQNGKEGLMFDEACTVLAVHNGERRFYADLNGYISLIPWGCEKAVVTIKGLKYELEHGELPCDRALGISNEFTGKDSVITVHEGTVIIVIEEEVNEA